jgi:hypothetical protein
MNARFAVTVLLLVGAAASSAFGNRKAMLPRPDELLKAPIHLKSCPVTIVEWRASSGKQYTYTGPSKKGVKIFDAACKKAVEAYPKFLKHEGLLTKRNANVVFKEKVALMPWEISLDGTDPRNLNDIADRFKNRTAFYNSQGQFLSIQGYSDRNDNFIYMRHDILWPDGSKNEMTEIIFAHELFHAMNDQYEVFQKLADNDEDRVAKDEVLARKFTKFIGLE